MALFIERRSRPGIDALLIFSGCVTVFDPPRELTFESDDPAVGGSFHRAVTGGSSAVAHRCPFEFGLFRVELRFR
jgi:hypothetical protein